MMETALERDRKGFGGRLWWPLVPVLATLTLLLTPDASAQIQPQPTGNDFCAYRSQTPGGNPGQFFARMPEGLDHLSVNLIGSGSGSGSVVAEMWGTSATECLRTNPAVCPPSCRLQVQTVCEFHCAHDHTAPYGWTVRLFPTGGSFLGWPNTACIATKGAPQASCIVRMDDAPGDQPVWAKFGAEPDMPPSAPFASVSGVGPYWMTVSWTQSTDDHWFGGYKIMNGGTELARVGPERTTFNLEALSCQTPYTIQVVAFDAVNNTPSNAVPVTTGACVGNSDTRPPNTVFHVKPPRVTRSRTASFHWGATESSRFRCKLDRAPWTKCRRSDPYVSSMGKTYRRLRPGYHTFRVYAIDRAGNRDRTPAVYRWRIRR